MISLSYFMDFYVNACSDVDKFRSDSSFFSKCSFLVKLDELLSRVYPGYSRNKLLGIIDSGCIKLKSPVLFEDFYTVIASNNCFIKNNNNRINISKDFISHELFSNVISEYRVSPFFEYASFYVINDDSFVKLINAYRNSLLI